MCVVVRLSPVIWRVVSFFSFEAMICALLLLKVLCKNACRQAKLMAGFFVYPIREAVEIMTKQRENRQMSRDEQEDLLFELTCSPQSAYSDSQRQRTRSRY